jgi:hypothetical protein
LIYWGWKVIIPAPFFINVFQIKTKRLYMADKSNTCRKQKPVTTRLKRELSKDFTFFSIGALSATFLILGRQRQRRLKKRYKEELKALKQNK